MKKYTQILSVLLLLIFIASCGDNNETENKKDKKMVEDTFKNEVEKYFEYELNSDLSHLSENQKKMIPILIEISDIMDQLHWELACGPYQKIKDTLSNEYAKRLFEINYGPWNRLNNNKPFIDGVGKKPKGAFFYPVDMTKEEFNNFEDETKNNLYTVIGRDDNGNLTSIPYHEYFNERLQKAAELLRKAAELAEDEGFKKYLELRADAFISGEYFESDMAWMDMTDNKIEFVVGPIENYEDGLFGTKTAFEAFVLIKDMEWSKKLAKYADLLPQLQKDLPVPEKYKQEEPGRNSQLNAYDAIYYAGDCNSASKTIAINLPNDANVQLKKGSRRLQLKNSMKAKFDSIVIPISEILIAPEQRKYVSFDAFFANTMFHEVAHGLGIKKTLDNPDLTCREALKDRYTTVEEGKADILGLWLIDKLIQMNEYEGKYIENQVTFVASLFRSIRFGAASSHGKANLMRYNFFIEQEAISRSNEGIYTINPEKMKIAADSLARLIITIQGDGDYELAGKIIDKYLVKPEELKKDLQKLEDADIPVDVVWKQGIDVLGL